MSYRWDEPDQDSRGPGAEFLCPQCGRVHFISASEAFPGFNPLCDACVTINQERNARMRAEQEQDVPPISRRA